MLSCAHQKVLVCSSANYSWAHQHSITRVVVEKYSRPHEKYSCALHHVNKESVLSCAHQKALVCSSTHYPFARLQTKSVFAQKCVLVSIRGGSIEVLVCSPTKPAMCSSTNVMDYEDILTEAGKVGVYQFTLFASMFVLVCSSAVQTSAVIFLNPLHDHWCKMPVREQSNLTTTDVGIVQINNTTVCHEVLYCIWCIL